MRFLYDLVLFFYHSGIHLAAFFNPKARMWVEGRRQTLDRIPSPVAGQQRFWVHCASLGEFEQGRPLIEALKKQYPDSFLLLTFYSPSGSELRKNSIPADWVCYLPADSASNARQFIEKIQPTIAIFVKYEFWYHHLNTLKQHNIPTLLVAALFRSDQIFFKFYGGFFRKILPLFSTIFVQNEASALLLNQIGIHHHRIAGDTRIDQVSAIAKTAKTLPLIQQFAEGHSIFIAGSTWPADEKIISEFLKNQLPKHWKVIIAPHEIQPPKIKALQQQVPLSHQLYSDALSHGLKDTKVLIIDNIGMLSSIYRYGTVAYIGGGFGKGIHNTLEPAVFGLPILFGKKYQQFSEAVHLVQVKAAFSVENSEALHRAFQQLQEEKFYQSAKENAQIYIESNRGATAQILADIVRSNQENKVN